MCKIGFKPSAQVGAASARDKDYSGEVNATASLGGLACDDVLYPFAAFSHQLKPVITGGMMFTKDAPAFAGVGLRASVHGDLLGMAGGIETGVDLTTAGLRIPFMLGLGVKVNKGTLLFSGGPIVSTDLSSGWTLGGGGQITFTFDGYGYK